MNVAKSMLGSAASSVAEAVMSVLATAERRLRKRDTVRVLGQIRQGRLVLLDVLVGQGAVLDVALADANVPIPRVDRLVGHRCLSLLLIRQAGLFLPEGDHI